MYFLLDYQQYSSHKWQEKLFQIFYETTKLPSVAEVILSPKN